MRCKNCNKEIEDSVFCSKKCYDEFKCPICDFGNNKDESGQWCICNEEV